MSVETPLPDMSVEEAGRTAGRVLEEVGRAVVGHRDGLRLVLATVLAGGHVLLTIADA